MTIPTEITSILKEKMYNKVFIISLVVLCFFMVYLSVVFFGNDNLFEQEVEKIIETETGAKIDFTP